MLTIIDISGTMSIPGAVLVTKAAFSQFLPVPQSVAGQTFGRRKPFVTESGLYLARVIIGDASVTLSI